MRYWEGSHPATRLGIRISWGTLQPAGPAEVKFWKNGSTLVGRYSCDRETDAFRDLQLEVDVCDSVNSPPILPEYDTHAHNTRPSDLPQRVLTLEEAYREEGVRVSVTEDRTIIDDSASEFDSWSVSELHDAMETHFGEYSGGWPKWHMWGLLAGTYDNSSVAGIMFDAGASVGGAGEPPERRGFAVFREHSWFDDLTTPPASNQDEARAMRQYLYTWVHEAGHAFNFLHSWDKGRPNSLSWMNYPQHVSDFWDDFEFRFDDEELIHLRHGDRSAVIMGGDPFGSGSHLSSDGDRALGRISPAEGNPPLELVVRSTGYFELLEPVEIELRLRNLVPDVPLTVDSRLRPACGNVAVYVQEPEGRVVRYKPVFYELGDPDPVTLKPADRSEKGEDRYSARVYVGYGGDGSYFDRPGEYRIRAVYQDETDLLAVSNIHSFRVGAPASKEEERLASDYFSPEVGLALCFGGSRSAHLEKGMNHLRELAERFPNSLVGAKAAMVVAQSRKEPFFSIQEGTVSELHSPDPEGALEVTNSALALFRERAEKDLNLAHHELVRTRAELLKSVDKVEQAREEVTALREDLSKRDVNEPVLNSIAEFGESL